ncbi:hypothetical protein EES41_39280 (plasmid) [Streptomyces sp. ADI95-16]|uniref:hypothetical protein n=1 Tax=Streptomyces sp. ADI95-16 TaxID=1522758 RepID=UPI000F3AA716|nr:hypothetical protein [Streptomyces sp. ADI95-16]AYV32816.1 hypothetical protein EES41_39280 [Streptomyces sp. ADI95-16]
MSRMAQVLVLARYEDEVMEPLTRDDESRTWRGRFEQIPGWFIGGWYIEFFRERQRVGILKDLEALPWNQPECVQVMLHDEDDDCFGLWMFREGKLVELPVSGTERFHTPAPPTQEYAPSPGHLFRTDVGHTWLPEQTPEELRDPRPAW